MRQTPERVVIECIIRPGAKREKIQLEDNQILIHTTEQPTKNKANKDILLILSETLNIPKRDLSIIGGMHTKNKAVLVRNISLEDLSNKLTLITVQSE
ncbi:uncharacterized protein NEOKW01_0325 [Nematocida sp. AWRm80]|nr:uncharacterized protein NEOKW01_0325 [Nematocida sp. AWRm80]